MSVSNKWRISQSMTEFLNTWSIHPRLQCDFVLPCLDSGVALPYNKRLVSVIEESGYWFWLNHQSGVSEKPITRKKLRTCPREFVWSHNPTGPITADKYSDPTRAHKCVRYEMLKGQVGSACQPGVREPSVVVSQPTASLVHCAQRYTFWCFWHRAA
jgi:hypothetical protein